MQPDWKRAWQPMVERVGTDFCPGEQFWGADPIEASAVRRFVEPLEFDCPLHTDQHVAEQYGYGTSLPRIAACSFGLRSRIGTKRWARSLRAPAPMPNQSRARFKASCLTTNPSRPGTFIPTSTSSTSSRATLATTYTKKATASRHAYLKKPPSAEAHLCAGHQLSRTSPLNEWRTCRSARTGTTHI